MACGVLMSELERGASAAGLGVTSWQALKPSSGESPYDRARSLGVSILFEVDELSTNVAVEEQLRRETVSFYEQVDATQRVPVAVSDVDGTATRCLDQRSAVARPTNVRESATLAVKMVAVEDGAVLWYYRATVGDDASSHSSSTDRYYPAGKDAPYAWAGWAGLGTVGASVLVAGASLDDPSLEPQQVIPVAVVAGLAGGTIAALARRHYSAAPHHDPETVVCRGSGVDHPPFMSAPVSDAVPDGGLEGTSYERAQMAGGSVDGARAREQQLIEQAVSGFVEALQE